MEKYFLKMRDPSERTVSILGYDDDNKPEFCHNCYCYGERCDHCDFLAKCGTVFPKTLVSYEEIRSTLVEERGVVSDTYDEFLIEMQQEAAEIEANIRMLERQRQLAVGQDE